MAKYHGFVKGVPFEGETVSDGRSEDVTAFCDAPVIYGPRPVKLTFTLASHQAAVAFIKLLNEKPA